MASTEETVKQLLDLAGIHPLEEDIAPMVANYETAQEQRALVFGVAEARYEEPDLIFSAKL